MPFSRLGPLTALFLKSTWPEVGVSRPPTIRITVVLPQPDGPTKTTNSPSAIFSDSGSTTGVSWPRSPKKTLVKDRNSIKASPDIALNSDSGRSGGDRSGSPDPRRAR